MKKKTAKKKKLLTAAKKPTGERTIKVTLMRMLAIVFNSMSPVADKEAGRSMMAEQIGSLTQAEVDYFVLHQLPKLPGYTVRDGLDILDRLTSFRAKYFNQ